LRWATRPVRPDVLFVHTQVPAVLLGAWMRRVPTVVSIDATPQQYDELGEHYAHTPGHPRVERAKFHANRRCFERAAHLVSWSQWGKQGLVEGYGIDPGKVTVIAPGVDVDRWANERGAGHHRCEHGGPVRILFVGGDLQRKGGDMLIEAVRALRADATMPEVELHLVTTADVSPEPGIVVHRGLTSNSAELIEQYHRADVFCLPTLGDCLPMVLAEAAAAGLPLVSTAVGAIGEIVRPGETGELIVPGDRDALVAALDRLVADPERRARYGAAARALAVRDHDARANAARIVDLLADVAGAAGDSRTGRG
jgi:glycosyltransferase involved in cell wall biosynthesis